MQAWNIGVQRLIAKNTVIEVRYVGNRASNVWHTFNLNEVNIFENGFLRGVQERAAEPGDQRANGLTGFANNGLPGQVRAADLRRGVRRARRAAGAAGQSGLHQRRVHHEPAAGRSRAGSPTASRRNQTYLCRMVGSTFSPCATAAQLHRAGSVPDELLPGESRTPSAAASTSSTTTRGRKYHAMQLQLRRRYANGLTANVNYTLGEEHGRTSGPTTRRRSHNYRTLRDKSLDMRAGAVRRAARAARPTAPTTCRSATTGTSNIENGVAERDRRRMDARRRPHRAVGHAVPALERPADGQRHPTRASS